MNLAKARYKAIVSQLNTGTVSKATAGKFMRDEVKRLRAVLIALMPSSAEQS